MSGGKFCPGIGFLAILQKKCITLNKRVKNELLAQNFQFWHTKVNENLPGH